MNSRLTALFFFSLIVSVATGADDAASPPAPQDRSPRMAKTGDFVLNLLPKSLQKNPFLEMTFYTEYTPYGRTQHSATPQRPVYYKLNDAGFRQLGWSVAGEKPPSANEMHQTLVKALERNGFLLADQQHPADLYINYFWGTHNRPDDDTAHDFPELLRKNILERALLIGGKSLADNVNFTIQWGTSQKQNVDKMEFLSDQADENIYFIVASAYDYRALAQKDRKLIWRTTMTAASAGLALDEAMRPLIASGGTYLGRETSEPEIGSRRILRDANVEIGDLRVLNDEPPASRPAKSP